MDGAFLEVKSMELELANAWIGTNCRFAMQSNEYLDHLLSPQGRTGSEKGRPVSDGIAVFRDEFGSYRYVMYEHGKAVSAIQVMSKDGKNGHVANAYTSRRPSSADLS